MDRSSPSVAQSAAEVAGILVPRTAELSADIYHLIVEEIPQLRADRGVLNLLDASVSENVATMLHILQHGIDTEQVHAPAAAQEYARRLAQRGVPISALLRAYRIGSFRFQEWCLRELGQRSRDASLVSAAGLRISETTSTYIDNVSEELVAAYEAEKENWLRNLSATRAARVRALLRGERVDVVSSETILGYRLGQHHVGVVCWLDEAEDDAGGLARLEHAVTELARGTRSEGRPIFVPQDEKSAWAWLPLGTSASFIVDGVTGAVTEPGVRFAVGDAVAGVPGFRLTHRQAVGAHAVAVHTTGPAAQRLTCFRDIAPLALMSDSTELMREWVLHTLGSLADDDDQNLRLRETLRVFLAENGSFKATAERLTLHKNTVQYRVRKAEEGLGTPVDQHRLSVELALLACQWLGPAVLRQAGEQRP